LGFGLLEGETAAAFAYFFGALAEALPSGTPEAVEVLFTDGDETLREEAAAVFKNALLLYCAWHIVEKSAARKLRGFLGETLWNKAKGRLWGVARATQQTVAMRQWASLLELLREHPMAVAYLRAQVEPKIPQFAFSYTREHLTLGQIATSRIEGWFAKIKRDRTTVGKP
jgi:hypothetical protein